MTALPKNIKTADLVEFFRGKVEDPEAAVAAVLDGVASTKPKALTLHVRVKPEDYAIASAALEGRRPFGTRTAMVALRQTALAYVLDHDKDAFAGWLEAQTVVAEHSDGPEPSPVEETGEPVPEEDDGEVVDPDAIEE